MELMSSNGAGLRARKDLHWQREKERRIEQALSSDPIDLPALQELSSSYGGLLNKQLRKKVWPKLVGVNVFYIYPYEGPPLSAHKERPQVLLDVNRCGKRIPEDFSAEARKTVQEQLERVILRLLAENPHLHYYQGLHDVVLTFLLVTGEDIAYAIMTALVRCHIRDFLDMDMNRTKVVIGCLSPLLALEDEQLEHFITKSECAYYFSLSWLITWYGHVVMSHDDAARLTDVFLASHPLLPVYVAVAIILTRRTEVLELECELSAVHSLLSKLPPDLSYEQMIMLALQLYKKHPPSMLLGAKQNYRLKQSSLIRNYSKFCSGVQKQQPDHILKHAPPPPRPSQRHALSSWWAWLAGRRWSSSSMLRVVLSVVGPVLIAMAIYLYINTTSSRTIAFRHEL